MCAFLKEEGSKQRNALEKWNNDFARFDRKLIIGPKKQTEEAKCSLFGHPVHWKLIRCNGGVGRAENSKMMMQYNIKCP